MEHEIPALNSLRAVVDEPFGIWWEDPFVDLRGDTYVPPEDGPRWEDLQAWGHPGNRSLLDEYAAKRTIYQFSMLMPLDTAPATLAMMNEELSRADLGHYDHYVDRVVDWLPEIRWAYVPLEHDCRFSVFLAWSPVLMSKFEAEVNRSKRIAFFLECDETRRVKWMGPTQF